MLDNTCTSLFFYKLDNLSTIPSKGVFFFLCVFFTGTKLIRFLDIPPNAGWALQKDHASPLSILSKNDVFPACSPLSNLFEMVGVWLGYRVELSIEFNRFGTKFALLVIATGRTQGNS